MDQVSRDEKIINVSFIITINRQIDGCLYFINAKRIDKLIVNVVPNMDVLTLFLQTDLFDRASGFPSDLGSIVKPQNILSLNKNWL